MEDLIGYDQIIEASMRNVIYEALKKIEKKGELPGNHHFVISFSTKHPETSVSKHLKDKFSEEMTIIVQHQFTSLKVNKDKFEITLNFSGKPDKLVVPYEAITSFADPSINFGLKFNSYEEINDENKEDSKDKSKKSKKNSNVDLSAKVVSLDAFRKDQDKKDD